MRNLPSKTTSLLKEINKLKEKNKNLRSIVSQLQQNLIFSEKNAGQSLESLQKSYAELIQTYTELEKKDQIIVETNCQLELEVTRLELLHQFKKVWRHLPPPAIILKHIAHIMLKGLYADELQVFLKDPQREGLTLEIYKTNDLPKINTQPRIKVKIGSPNDPLYQSIELHKILRYSPTKFNQIRNKNPVYFIFGKNYIFMPLYTKKRNLGCIVFSESSANKEIFSSEDFLQLLSQQISLMLDHADHTLRVYAENHKNHRELQIARKIQKNILPKAYFLSKSVKCFGIQTPALDVGGDFFTYIKFREKEKIGFAIGDVSGKGVGASLLMSMVVSILEEKSIANPSPKKVLQATHDTLKKHMDPAQSLFVTLFYGLYDSHTKRLTYCRGGHPYPLLYRNDGSLIQLTGKGPCLALIDPIYLEECSVDLYPGDKIFCYTDGLVESIGKNGRPYGENQVQKVLQKYKKQSVDQWIKALFRDHREHVPKENRRQDDCTLLGIEILN